ncbi:MAG: hypothetical protein AAGE93_11510 [Bacteroidota bacterium]
MKPLIVLLLSSLVFGALIGVVLRLAVPSMSTQMSDTALVGLSSLAMLLFLPSWLGYLFSERYVAAMIVQLIVGVTAGIVSGYFWDSVLSCVLVGVMASLALWLVAFFRADPSLVYWAAGVVALVSVVLNVAGHTLGSRSLWVYLLLAAGTLASSQLTTWIAYRLADYLTIS